MVDLHIRHSSGCPGKQKLDEGVRSPVLSHFIDDIPSGCPERAHLDPLGTVCQTEQQPLTDLSGQILEPAKLPFPVLSEDDIITIPFQELVEQLMDLSRMALQVIINPADHIPCHILERTHQCAMLAEVLCKVNSLDIRVLFTDPLYGIERPVP